MAPARRTALVTGASSGIGEQTAVKLAARGYTVYGAARRVDRLENLRSKGVEPLVMDVTDDASMTAGITRIVDETGRIDVLVNNAGYGSYGAIEDVPQQEARRQFDVNVFGAMRLTQLVLPRMRAQRSGLIVNISSMGGRIHTPLGGWYHATKFALEGLSDCLRVEVAPFGIDVVVIEPGGIATEWGGIAASALRATSGDGAYAEQADAVATRLSSDFGSGHNSSPSLIAETVVKAGEAKKPRTRYAVGFAAKPLIGVREVLPDRVYDRLIRRIMGVR